MNDIHHVWALKEQIESKENPREAESEFRFCAKTESESLRSWHSEAVCTNFRSQSLIVEGRTTEACTLLQKLQSEVQGCQHQQRTKVRS